MPVKTRGSAENVIAKALRHPLRVEVLAILDNRVASPSEMALELNQSLGNVAYHVKELVRFKCAELVDTRQVRGATEHFYRAIRRPYFQDEDWVSLPLGARQGISSAVLQMVAKDASNSLDEGAFDRRGDRHLSRTPLVLDERGWREMNGMLNAMVEKALDMQAEAAARLTDAGDEGMSVRLILMGFESGGPEDDESQIPSRGDL